MATTSVRKRCAGAKTPKYRVSPTAVQKTTEPDPSATPIPKSEPKVQQGEPNPRKRPELEVPAAVSRNEAQQAAFEELKKHITTVYGEDRAPQIIQWYDDYCAQKQFFDELPKREDFATKEERRAARMEYAMNRKAQLDPEYFEITTDAERETLLTEEFLRLGREQCPWR